MIKVRDSIEVTLHKYLNTIRQMLPETLYAEFCSLDSYLKIGIKINCGIFKKHYTVNRITMIVDYTDIKLKDKTYRILAEKIAEKLDLELVIDYIEGE